MNRFLRTWHRRISIFIALPFLITVVTGILLATRAFNPWVSAPVPEIKTELTLSYADVLRIAKDVPDAQITSWNEIAQINAAPKTGIIRVRTKNHWELAINGSTGEVLSSTPRRVGWLVALHEGEFFGSYVRYGLFLPSAICVLFLLLSGVGIYAISWRNKRRLRQQ